MPDMARFCTALVTATGGSYRVCSCSVRGFKLAMAVCQACERFGEGGGCSASGAARIFGARSYREHVDSRFFQLYCCQRPRLLNVQIVHVVGAKTKKRRASTRARPESSQLATSYILDHVAAYSYSYTNRSAVSQHTRLADMATLFRKEETPEAEAAAASSVTAATTAPTVATAPARKTGFFQDDSDSDDDMVIVDSGAGPSNVPASEEMTISSDDDKDEGPVSAAPRIMPKPTFGHHYFGGACSAFSRYSSAAQKLTRRVAYRHHGRSIRSLQSRNFLRSKEWSGCHNPSSQSESACCAEQEASKGGHNRSVRADCSALHFECADYSDPSRRSFKNSKGQEVGRISEVDAAWIAKLLDLDLLTFTGQCVDVPRHFRSGTSERLTTLGDDTLTPPPGSHRRQHRPLAHRVHLSSRLSRPERHERRRSRCYRGRWQQEDVSH